jgi:hypothetical protein
LETRRDHQGEPDGDAQPVKQTSAVPRKRNRRYDDAFSSVARIFAAVATVLAGRDLDHARRSDDPDHMVVGLVRLLRVDDP